MCWWGWRPPFRLDGRRGPAEVEDGVGCVDVLYVAAVEVGIYKWRAAAVGGHRVLLILGNRGQDGVLETIRSEDVLLPQAVVVGLRRRCESRASLVCWAWHQWRQEG